MSLSSYISSHKTESYIIGAIMIIGIIYVAYTYLGSSSSSASNEVANESAAYQAQTANNEIGAEYASNLLQYQATVQSNQEQYAENMAELATYNQAVNAQAVVSAQKNFLTALSNISANNASVAETKIKANATTVANILQAQTAQQANYLQAQTTQQANYMNMLNTYNQGITATNIATAQSQATSNQYAYIAQSNIANTYNQAQSNIANSYATSIGNALQGQGSALAGQYAFETQPSTMQSIARQSFTSQLNKLYSSELFGGGMGMA